MLVDIEWKWDAYTAKLEPAPPVRTESLPDLAAQYATNTEAEEGHYGDRRDSASPTMLWVPHPYVFPGGRFKAQFYWDSYFVVLALLESDRRFALARGMVDNLLYSVDKHGMVVTNRLRWAGGSQMPFLAPMVEALYLKMRERGDATRDDWFKNALVLLVKEYEFWTEPPHIPESEGKDLSRYHAPTWFVDGRTLDQAQRAQVLAKITADSEVSWDESPRFDETNVLHIQPVDLNCNLYAYEALFETYEVAPPKGNHGATWTELKTRRLKAIDAKMWNPVKGMYFDYNWKDNTRSAVESLATVWPLYFRIASREQAQKVRNNIIDARFEHDGGLVTSPQGFGSAKHQWSFPIGWAPLHWMAVKGLWNYGYYEDAERIARKWLRTVQTVWVEPRVDPTTNTAHCFLEKYNVVDTRHPDVLPSEDRRYVNQVGFGWTNAVTVLLSNLIILRADVKGAEPGRSLLPEEYNYLRSEIRDNSQKIYEIVKYSIGTAVGVIALTSTWVGAAKGATWFEYKEVPFLLLLPLPVLTAGVHGVRSLLNATFRSASYIMTHHEECRDDIKWESNVQRLRRGDGVRDDPGVRTRGFTKSLGTLIKTAFWITFVVSLLSWWLPFKSSTDRPSAWLVQAEDIKDRDSIVTNLITPTRLVDFALVNALTNSAGPVVASNVANVTSEQLSAAMNNWILFGTSSVHGLQGEEQYRLLMHASERGGAYTNVYLNRALIDLCYGDQIQERGLWVFTDVLFRNRLWGEVKSRVLVKTSIVKSPLWLRLRAWYWHDGALSSIRCSHGSARVLVGWFMLWLFVVCGMWWLYRTAFDKLEKTWSWQNFERFASKWRS